MRITKSELKMFLNDNKHTIIREFKTKIGEQQIFIGPKKNPRMVGLIEVFPYTKKCKVNKLRLTDAQSEGYESLCDMLLEIGRTNKRMTGETEVYVYPVKLNTIYNMVI